MNEWALYVPVPHAAGVFIISSSHQSPQRSALSPFLKTLYRLPSSMLIVAGTRVHVGFQDQLASIVDKLDKIIRIGQHLQLFDWKDVNTLIKRFSTTVLPEDQARLISGIVGVRLILFLGLQADFS